MFKLLLKVSRPRFWMYLAGPYLIGYIIAANSISQLFSLKFFVGLLYFLIPANIFLYSINDIFDQKTDSNNLKKDMKEIRINKGNRKRVVKLAAFSAFLSFLMMLFFNDKYLNLIFIFFLLLSFFYSSPPMRFKKIPFLDFSSNFLYILPGIIGYVFASGKLAVDPAYLFAGYFWTSAMHLFSAIPDIEYDKKAGIMTTAVFLGKKKSLALTGLFWLFFVLILFSNEVPILLKLSSIIYPILPLTILVARNISIRKIYWYYPLINNAYGFLLFIFAIKNQ